MSPQPCKACGGVKKPGHPLYCWDCWLPRQPLAVQLREARASRARALEVYGDGVVELGRVSAMVWPDGRRWCAGCLRFRRFDAFAKAASRCRPCAWEQSHESMVKRTYGLEGGGYDAMLQAQGGRCAICRNQQKMRALAVHHDHKSGAVVALLCKSCNHDLLGGAWDSPELLLRAWAVQVRGWPLAQEALECGGQGTRNGQLPATWPERLRYLADRLEEMPEPEPVEGPPPGAVPF